MTQRPAAWRRYLRFWDSNIPDDVDAEIAFHVEMRTREYIARGMTESDARQAVVARLGNVDAARAESVRLLDARQRQAKQAGMIDGLRADVRFALRSLRRAPGWTAVVLLTIALGVGATTTVFTVANALLVRPLAYPGASRVVIVEREIALRGHTTTFAALAVLLAAIGLYGVIAYAVAQRMREIGIRIALGATRASIGRLVVGDGLRLALIGVALGLAGAVAATRLIENLLYGVSRMDPLSFGVTAVLLLAIGGVASVVPMLRATSVDPVITVRVE